MLSNWANNRSGRRKCQGNFGRENPDDRSRRKAVRCSSTAAALWVTIDTGTSSTINIRMILIGTVRSRTRILINMRLSLTRTRTFPTSITGIPIDVWRTANGYLGLLLTGGSMSSVASWCWYKAPPQRTNSRSASPMTPHASTTGITPTLNRNSAIPAATPISSEGHSNSPLMPCGHST